MELTQLVICGSIALDRIMSFSGRYKDLIKPDKLDVLSISQLLSSLENSPGGIGANIAYSSALLGERPILLGSVGKDAREYMQKLSYVGVDTTHVHTSELPTSSFNVINDSDGNQVGGFYPGAMGDSDLVSMAPWNGKKALAIISAYDPSTMNRLVAECKNFVLPYVYDPGQQVANTETDVASGIESAEILCVNEYEFSLLCERLNKAPDQLKAQVPVIITTLGANGSIIEGSKLASPITIAAAKPAQVVDPTGAGDAYRSGFLYGYLRQWELAECGRLGSVIASFIVEQSGTQIPLSKPAISQRFKETFNREVNI